MFIKCGRVAGFLRQFPKPHMKKVQLITNATQKHLFLSHCISLSKLLSQPCCNNFVINLYLTSFDLFQSSFLGFKTKREKVYKLYDNKKPKITKSKHPYPQLKYTRTSRKKYSFTIYYLLCTLKGLIVYKKVTHAYTCMHTHPYMHMHAHARQ